MDKIFPHLREDYHRWIAKIGPSPIQGKNLISIEDVLKAHYLLSDFFLREGEKIAAHGPKNVDMLMSALGRQVVSNGEFLKWEESLDIVSTLYFGLIKNHPFHDGNKRTAFLVAIYHLSKIGRTPDAPQKDFEQLAVRTAGNMLSEYSHYQKFKKKDDAIVLFLSDFFRRSTRKIETRMPIITYNHLNTVLKRYGFELDNPNGNYIDVVKPRSERHGLLLHKTRVVKDRIANIGFPGWKNQIQPEALGRVLRATKLTPENGYDTAVIFGGESPLNSMIETYKGPLKRLKDR